MTTGRRGSIVRNDTEGSLGISTRTIGGRRNSVELKSGGSYAELSVFSGGGEA